LGHNLGRTIKAKSGDRLTVNALGVTKEVVVQGIVKQVLGAPIYVPMSLFSQWTPLGLRPANQAYVRVDPARRLESQRALNALPGVIGVEDWPSTIKDLSVTDFNGNFALIFLGFGVTLTFVVLFTSISASLHERRNELAIMRTQGVSMGEIWRMVTWEIAIAVGLGLLLGILPTLQLVEYIMQLYDTDVAGNLAIIYPTTWLIAIAILVVTALVSQVLPLRGMRDIDLGEVSKSVGV
jgi:ABC-type lipoprotein release transport system permease subunit